MSTVLLTLLFAVLLVAFAFAGFAVKIIFKKKGEFKRHCSSIDPYTGERSGCVCGKLISDTCKSDRIQGTTKTKFHPLEVNEELLREANAIPTKH